ncbi:twin-arginine translocase TatA/TatE family subunit, partial [Brucella abortus]|nr:twin-arginine translocase TatA/TatE family subunit [Brucella abortus]
IPELMGDVAIGYQEFLSQGMADEDAKEDPRTIDAKAEEPVKDVKKTTKS